ncbi:MAG TPA: hypothetical protein VM889_11295 [Candidatus Thermoplasmatota archaeon]|nr:hypothetical protein [Candidatus Thermoplasmatota archaeon]
MAKIVHVVGTGTIGEPLVGLLSRHRRDLGIDEVTFYKHSPRATDRPMIVALRHEGARLAVAEDKKADFEKLGIKADLTATEALERASIVIDCTPEDSGLENKETKYKALAAKDKTKRFFAQGSEEGFGTMFALGINDQAVKREEQFFQVVSCNTHNISVLVKALGLEGERVRLKEGRFVAIRRAGDVGDVKFIQAPKVEKHKEANGTHHATDVVNLYKTINVDLDLYSSAMKLNTPYMHTLWFNLRLDEPTTKDKIMAKLAGYKYIGLTEKDATNTVFAFAREHGPYGRILNQTVVSVPSVAVHPNGREVTGFAFTPQDGNVLLSNIALATRMLYPDDWEKRMAAFDPYLLKEW